MLGSKAYVAPEKRKAIQEAIQKLDYHPNVIAKSMSNRRMDNIGIVLAQDASSAFQSQYVPPLLAGFWQELSKNNMQMLLLMAKDREDEVQKCLTMYSTGNVQGFILMRSRYNDQTVCALSAADIPFVLVGNINYELACKLPAINMVDTDNTYDVKNTTMHVIAQGHRRIALIHSSSEFIASIERRNGYYLALQQNGIPIDDSLVFECEQRISKMEACCDKLLSSDRLPTAVVATDDMIAVTFIKRATERGLKVPEDISVVGHNNYPVSRLCTPSLTTVDVPLVDLGDAAANLLMEHLRNKDHKPRRILLPTSIVVRNSVAPPGGGAISGETAGA